MREPTENDIRLPDIANLPLASSSEFEETPEGDSSFDSFFDVTKNGDIGPGWQDVVTWMIVETALVRADAEEIDKIRDGLRRLYRSYENVGDRSHHETLSTLFYLLNNLETQMTMLNPPFEADSLEATVLYALTSPGIEGLDTEQIAINTGYEREAIVHALKVLYENKAVEWSVVSSSSTTTDRPGHAHKITGRGRVMVGSLMSKR